MSGKISGYENNMEPTEDKALLQRDQDANPPHPIHGAGTHAQLTKFVYTPRTLPLQVMSQPRRLLNAQASRP